MPRLSVNVNKIALLRNQRHNKGPDVVKMAGIAVDAGAHGITVHPRPDGRHIRPHDVKDLAELIATRPDAELNVEGNPFEGNWLTLVHHVTPQQATLVPDAPGQSTSDHGFVAADAARLKPIVDDLTSRGIRVSVFVDPDPSTITALAACGCARVELYTESYAEDASMLDTFVAAAEAAHAAGLGVNAGHDLNLDNLPTFVQRVPHLDEVSIGHALIADALLLGMQETVTKYKHALA
jgi:pyridoxine 5-phosphate synthase